MACSAFERPIFAGGRRRKPGRCRTAGQPGFASSVVDLHKRYSKVLQRLD
jgi:hypothetical protein